MKTTSRFIYRNIEPAEEKRYLGTKSRLGPCEHAIAADWGPMAENLSGRQSCQKLRHSNGRGSKRKLGLHSFEAVSLAATKSGVA